MNLLIKHINTFILALGLLGGLSAYPMLAAEQNVNPGINRHYQQADYDDWVGVFETRGREVFDRRREIMAALDVRPGMAVADIGAGTGLYTRLLARAVGPQGKVYAIDPVENFIEEIMNQARSQGDSHVSGIVNAQKQTGLPPASIELAFVCATYHHFEYPRAMLASIHQALKPGGHLVIIDFRKVAGQSSAWVMQHSRADKETLIKEVESEGFNLTHEENFLKANFFLRFERKIRQ